MNINKSNVHKMCEAFVGALKKQFPAYIYSISLQ